MRATWNLTRMGEFVTGDLFLPSEEDGVEPPLCYWLFDTHEGVIEIADGVAHGDEASLAGKGVR